MKPEADQTYPEWQGGKPAEKKTPFDHLFDEYGSDYWCFFMSFYTVFYPCIILLRPCHTTFISGGKATTLGECVGLIQLYFSPKGISDWHMS